MPDDAELLRRYTEEGSEAAFTELVRRYLDFVYGVALRRVGGDVHRAQDVVQEVFTALARNAVSLRQRPALGGWLCRAAQFTAIDIVRADTRRQAREQAAEFMSEITADLENIDGDKLRPLLDRTMSELNDSDRDAVWLRFFEGLPFADVGARLRLTENAARMRVERALDKLRALLARRGVTSTGAALAAMLGSQAGVAAPAGLATAVAGAAMKGGAVTTFGLMNSLGAGKFAAAIGLIGVCGIGTFLYNRNDPLKARPAPGREQFAEALPEGAAGSERMQAMTKNASARAGVLAREAGEILGLRAATPGSPAEKTGKTPGMSNAALAVPLNTPHEDQSALVLDLAPFYRRKFAEQPGATARFAPLHGRQLIDGVPLLIDGEILLHGQTQAERARGAAAQNPGLIEGIRVGRKFEELHLVHHTVWVNFEGQPVAVIVFHYEDGTSAEVPIAYGAQVRDWTRLPSEEKETLTDAGSKIFWRGPGVEQLHAAGRLFKSTLNNPQPGKAVSTLDVRSAAGTYASYALIAASVTQRDPSRVATAPVPSAEAERNFTGSLAVHVIEAGTRRPVEGAVVSVAMKVEGVDVIASPAITNNQGEAIVRFPASTTVEIYLDGGKQGWIAKSVKWRAGEPVPTLELEPAAR